MINRRHIWQATKSLGTVASEGSKGYCSRQHTLNTRCYKQEVLFLELEELWFLVKDKRIIEEDAQSRLSFLKKRISENEFFDDDDGFEFSQEILDKAGRMTADT